MEKSTWDYDHLPCSALLGMSRSLAKETFLKNFKKNKKVYQQQSTVFIINNQSASVGGEKKKVQILPSITLKPVKMKIQVSSLDSQEAPLHL